jgi:ubiquinone/menaquinone biosynthesis C-methylase UbiE
MGGWMDNITNFWNENPVDAKAYSTVEESMAALKYRNSIYPNFEKLMPYEDHSGKIIMDYGCGPGIDIVGFMTYSNPKTVIGVDVAEIALEKARARCALHGQNFRLLNAGQANDLPDNYVDYVHSCGAIHHTTRPEESINYIHRKMKPRSTGRIMVYNYDSLWAHLYVAYYLQIKIKKYSNLPLADAMSLTTDGEACPCAKIYRQSDFLQLLRFCNFDAKYVGSYYAIQELNFYNMVFEEARACQALPTESREFLRSFNTNDEPKGIGAVYAIEKR